MCSYRLARVASVPMIAAVLATAPLLAATKSELQDATEVCRHASDRPTIISSCSTVIALSKYPPLLERAYNRRGLAYEQMGQFEPAAMDYSAVIRLNPTIAGYFDNRMRAYKALGRLDLALRDADMAVSMAPSYAFALHGRSAVRFDRGEYDAAVRDLTAALAINPADASMHVDRGRSLIKLGRVDDALRDFDAAHAIEPASEEALRQRGMAFAQLGRRDQARADLSAAVAIRPNDGDAADALRRLEGDEQPASGRPAPIVADADPFAAASPVPQVGRSGSPPGAVSAAPQTPRPDDAVRQADLTPASGAPFCTDKDELQEYVLAALKKDEQWMSQLTSCAFLKGGLKIALIKAGTPTSGMHVDKVRIFGPTGSTVGYTLTVDRNASN